ncbi:MAG: hypothetical protein ACOX4A_03830 [Saccharofermentanales bacterium]|jgi:CobQ-like glutamine amidotransferase family enzyme
MRVEILYGELANLLGEHGTQNLLAQTFGESKIVRTAFPERPAFLKGDVDFVYMGPMTEQSQRLVLDRWSGLSGDFRDAIDRGVVFFFTGNALDLVGRSIEYEEGESIEALGLFPFDTYCHRYERRNEIIYGNFQSADVMGFRSQFTTHRGDLQKYAFIQLTHGDGTIAGSRNEGIRDNHFFATELLGPFLILNPHFTKWLFSLIGFDGQLPFEEALLRAYDVRIKDFRESFSL